MDRKQILDRWIKVEPNQPYRHSSILCWDFHSLLDVRHSGGPVTKRKYRLLFNPADRKFSALGTRRLSKRKKRQAVFVSIGMVRYLRSRLSPEAIAACTVASMTARRPG